MVDSYKRPYPSCLKHSKIRSIHARGNINRILFRFVHNIDVNTYNQQFELPVIKIASETVFHNKVTSRILVIFEKLRQVFVVHSNDSLRNIHVTVIDLLENHV